MEVDIYKLYIERRFCVWALTPRNLALKRPLKSQEQPGNRIPWVRPSIGLWISGYGYGQSYRVRDAGLG